MLTLVSHTSPYTFLHYYYCKIMKGGDCIIIILRCDIRLGICMAALCMCITSESGVENVSCHLLTLNVHTHSVLEHGQTNL